jgi:general secretion pathway protein A
MFTTHFKLSDQPFLEHMPVDRLQQDDRMAQGMARLKYFTETGSIALLTGQTGVGKSSLLKIFFHSLNRNRHVPIYVHLTHVKSVGLLKLIVRSLGEIPARGKENLFLQILEKAKKTELTTILIIDEGHLTDADALIDLRLLVSADLEREPPLKLILTGQEALWRELKRTAHADLIHRISVKYHLAPLGRDETAAYIDFQMRSAGGSDKVFLKEAKELIHDYTGGVPRQINNVATACLINAATHDAQRINAELVNTTMAEFHLP